MSLGPGLGAPGTEGIVEPEGPTNELAKTDDAKPQVAAGRSPGQIAWARLRKDKIAIICAFIILFFVLIAIFAPLLSALEGQDPNKLNTELVAIEDAMPTIGATSDHWFGIEPGTGRDLFARFVYGARPSLIIGTVAAVVTTILGTAAGLVAGYFGGWVDRGIGWLIDFVLSLPFLIFAIAIVPVVLGYFGTADELTAETVSRVRFGALIGILIFFGWAGLARLVRGEVLSMREREFVQAAKSLGVPTGRILRKEILPNLTGLILVNLTLAIPAYISAEAGLSFLGVGLAEPSVSWGLTIQSAADFFEAYPIYLWIPVLSLALLVLALSLLGDAVSDAFNPNTRR